MTSAGQYSGVARYLIVQDRISEVVGKIISWIAVALTALLLFEVVMRYGFNRPTSWGHELSTMLFGIMGIFAGAYTLRHQGHVRSEIVYMYMPRWLQRLCDVIVFLLGLVVLIILFRMAISFAYSSWQMNEVSGKSSWRPIIWPVKSMIPVAVALLILQNIAELVRAVVKLFNSDFIDPRDAEAEPVR